MARVVVLAVAGALLGAAVGYLAAPTVPVVGTRVGVMSALTFGSDLGQLEGAVLGGLAAQAGRYLYGGAVFFALVGAGVGKVLAPKA